MRREWGAVTFVLTVIAGMIVVPVALYFANVGPNAISVPTVPITASPIACSSPTPSPSAKPTKSPTPSPAKSPTPSPTKSP